jgi:hypothetical protein
VIDAEPLETRLAGDRHVVGPAVDEAALAVRAAHVAELRGNQHLVTPAAEGLAQKLLVLAEPVGVRGVKQCDAEFDRPVDGGGGFGVVRYPVIGTHARAPEPDGRDTGAVPAELPMLHAFFLPRSRWLLFHLLERIIAADTGLLHPGLRSLTTRQAAR